MARKYRRVRKTENVIVFPGTFEKLVEKGTLCVERENYIEAVEAFDQAIKYEPDFPEFLGPYAVALYETKDFIRAKEVAGQLLHSGTANYMDAMELYLTISIQLEEYEEVELTIGALLDEGIVPVDMLKKFNYLRELSERLSHRYGMDDYVDTQEIFTLAEFRIMNPHNQQMALASLEGTDLTNWTSLLQEIVEMGDISALVSTFALTLLHQAGFDGEVTIRKFGHVKSVIPKEIALPGQDELTQDVFNELEKSLVKDPSKLAMARGLVEKFAITAFPFSWGSYLGEEIADAYILYIECLFTGGEPEQTELMKLIQLIDNDSNF